jgi:hypothetical protein
MSDEIENPFGVSLLKEKLRAPSVLRTKETGDRLQLRSPLLEARGVAGGRLTAINRGLTQGLGEQRVLSLGGRSGSPGNAPSDPSTFVREMSSLQVQGMFMMKRPANVTAKDLKENDASFTNRGAPSPMASFIGKTARQFGVSRGLLAEHLVGESAFAKLAQVPANATLGEYLKVTTEYTANLGLDDFVKDAKEIGPAAEEIVRRARPADFIVAESKRGAYQEAVLRGASSEELAKFQKPQLKLTLADAIPATAMYLRYKERLARAKIADFDTFPTEIRLQLVRLFVNPPSGTRNLKRGIDYIIKEANAGNYMNLFDFSDRTARQTTDTTKATNVIRRATIHTARAIHLEREVLADE